MRACKLTWARSRTQPCQWRRDEVGRCWEVFTRHERRSRPSIEHGTRRLGQGVILAEIVVPKPCAVVEPLKVHSEGEAIRRIVVVELGRLEGPQLRTGAARIRAFGDGA